MELFRAEKVGEIESTPVRICRACNEKLKLIRSVLTEQQLVRLFECKCGERIWDE